MVDNTPTLFIQSKAPYDVVAASQNGQVFYIEAKISELEISLEKSITKLNSTTAHWVGHLVLHRCHPRSPFFGYDQAIKYGVFRLASRLTYSPSLNQSILENLSELGISPNLNSPVIEVPYGLDQSLQINNYACQDECAGVPSEDHCDFTLPCRKNPIEQLICYILAFKRLLSQLKKLTIEAIQLQYIANTIHNRISRSPSPYKKEPPIGGVKVGGKQHHNHRHVARTLYLRESLLTMT